MSFVEKLRSIQQPISIAWCGIGDDLPTVPGGLFGKAENVHFFEPYDMSGRPAELIMEGVERRRYPIMPYVNDDSDPIGLSEAHRFYAFLKVANTKRKAEMARGKDFDVCVLYDKTFKTTSRYRRPHRGHLYAKCQYLPNVANWEIDTHFLYADTRTFDRLSMFFRLMPMYKTLHLPKANVDTAFYYYTKTVNVKASPL
jgi:hypothetical protein